MAYRLFVGRLFLTKNNVYIMKTKQMVTVALITVLIAMTSCGNNNKQNQNAQTGQQTTTMALNIDDLLSDADSLVNQIVTIEGICTHTCQHGATKIFLMGSDDTKTIRVEAGELGSFDTKCVNAIVTVTGTLKEQRVDEAYLQNWEAKLKAQTTQTHGETTAGCDSEKKARGETANTPEGRIADFRMKIAERKAATGKDYLSFYYLEAHSYEIEE